MRSFKLSTSLASFCHEKCRVKAAKTRSEWKAGQHAASSRRPGSERGAMRGARQEMEALAPPTACPRREELWSCLCRMSGRSPPQVPGGILAGGAV